MNKAMLAIGCAFWFSFAFLWVAPQEAHACSCAKAPTVQDALQGSTAVFSGKVQRKEDKKGWIRSSAEPVEVTLAVETVWKGELKEQVTIRTALSEASCGYGFDLHQEYIVYASADASGQLQTTLCSRTKPKHAAAEDRSVLGAGQQPFEAGAADGQDEGLTAAEWVYLTVAFGLSYFISLPVIRMVSRRNQDRAAAVHPDPAERTLGGVSGTLLRLAAAVLLTLVVYWLMYAKDYSVTGIPFPKKKKNLTRLGSGFSCVDPKL